MDSANPVSPTPDKSADFVRSRHATKAFSSSLLEILPEALQTGDLSSVETLIEQFDLTAVENDKSAWERIHEDVDGWCRNQVLTKAVRGETIDVEYCRNIVRLVLLTSGRSDAPFFSLTLPCTLFMDILDVVTIDAAESIFGVLEEFREVWKSPPFVESNKNVILRLCNNLLKRLSKSQNTDLCSRILLLLAAVLPPFERSGLNVIGEFNLENVTHFSAKSGDEKSGPKLPQSAGTKELEGKMYETFWGLQDFFRHPMQLYTTGTNFKKFKDSCDEVFRLLQTYKLESISADASPELNDSSPAVEQPVDDDVVEVGGGGDSGAQFKSRGEVMEVDDDGDGAAKSEPDPMYEGISKSGGRGRGFFAKYLTNLKLMDLEIRDSTFRRSFLTQFMIIAQFHLHPFKFRAEKNQLSGSQRQWLQKSCALALKLIRETPPDGPRAATFLRKVLMDERRWITWKNTGCKPAVPVTEVSKLAPKSSEGEPSTGETDDSKSGHGLGTESILARGRLLKAKLYASDGSAQSPMDKLCALPRKSDYALSRFGVTPPSIDTFCADVLEHVDKKVMPPKVKRLMADPTFTWRAMRLMKTKSSSFFAVSSGIYQLNVTDSLKQLLKTAKAENVAKEKAILAASNPPTNSGGELSSVKEEREEPSMAVTGNGYSASVANSIEGDEDGADSAGDGRRSLSPIGDGEGAGNGSSVAIGEDDGDGGGSADEGEDGDENGEAGRRDETPLTGDLIDGIAPKIEGVWMSLGKRLQYKEDELEHFRTEAKDDSLQAAKLLLRNWMENEDEPTLENLSYWCDAVGVRI